MPALPPVAEPDPVEKAVEAALPAMERGQFDAALTSLQSALGERPTKPERSAGEIAHRADLRSPGAHRCGAGGVPDLRATYPKDPGGRRLLRMADLVEQTRQPDLGPSSRGRISTRSSRPSPTTNVAPRALAQRAAIEQRENVKVTDPVLQRVVPAALVSYRQLAEAYPHSAPAETAFIQLAGFYDD